MAAELGALIEIKLADHLERQQIALQNADFGVEIALVVIVDDRHRVFEGDEIGIGFVDDDLSNRLVDGSLAQAGDGNGDKNANHDAGHQPFSLDENAEIFAQSRFLRRQNVIKRGADRLEEFSRFAGMQLAQSVAVSGD